eukprot:gnl/TRDRNA2_/TRDRNA2_67473_c0_seq1.p1 gnl/TRDRNA2_/TRDRNA2_67473_c0~~gnl/TRDRNA2_/TRDRNA2_67473_c0_seq1.p1  ORF type:complete len:351 (+),score=53.23 gnl/TRDRNA2_/TRDRNA2_67473_c0_seq1:70-1122(+)
MMWSRLTFLFSFIVRAHSQARLWLWQDHVGPRQFSPAMRTGTLNQQAVPAFRADMYRRQVSPTTGTGISYRPDVPAVRAHSLHRQSMPTIRASDAKADSNQMWKDWFLPPTSSDAEQNKKFIENWENSGKAWAGDSRTATLKGLMAAVSKWNAGQTVQRARATAAIALEKAEKAAEAAAEEQKKAKGSGFSGGKDTKEKSLAEEIADRFITSAELWDAASKATAQASRTGWTPEGARIIMRASRQTANIAMAADLQEVAAAWRIASAAWEGSALEMEGVTDVDPLEGAEGVRKAPKKEEPTTMLSEAPLQVSQASALLGFAAGVLISFAAFRFRFGASRQAEELLLPAHS